VADLNSRGPPQFINYAIATLLVLVNYATQPTAHLVSPFWDTALEDNVSTAPHFAASQRHTCCQRCSTSALRRRPALIALAAPSLEHRVEDGHAECRHKQPVLGQPAAVIHWLGLLVATTAACTALAAAASAAALLACAALLGLRRLLRCLLLLAGQHGCAQCRGGAGLRSRNERHAGGADMHAGGADMHAGGADMHAGGADMHAGGADMHARPPWQGCPTSRASEIQ
jgi:hypothetical protein